MCIIAPRRDGAVSVSPFRITNTYVPVACVPGWREVRDGPSAHLFFGFSQRIGMQKSTQEIEEIVERTVTGLGFEFVELERLARGLMRVTIDTEKAGGIAVDDCQVVSDQLTHLFAVESIDFDRLEVSSPGVERALKRLIEWKRFAGKPAHVELFEPMFGPEFSEAGRRKFDGHILGVTGSAGEEMIEFSIEELKIARTPREAVRAKKTKTVEVAPIVVRFSFKDVDRAHLIAELDFKGTNK